MSTGVFARTGTGDEAYLHTGINSLGMVEIVILGLGRGTVLMLTPADALSLALSIQLAVAAPAVPPENGDTP
jgi:hypothetical protein